MKLSRLVSIHYDPGKRFAALREEGVLVNGSGNLVHNLHTCAWGARGVQPFDWAVRFENRVRELMVKGDDFRIVAYEELGRDAMLCVPKPTAICRCSIALALAGTTNQAVSRYRE